MGPNLLSSLDHYASATGHVTVEMVTAKRDFVRTVVGKRRPSRWYRPRLYWLDKD